MDDPIKENIQNKKNTKKNTFTSNSKYFTISIYVLAVVGICACFIKAIMSWETTKNFIISFLVAISPFIIGLIIAFVLNPLVNQIDKYFCLKILHIKKATIRKAISIILSYFIFVGLIALIFVVLIPQLGRSVTDLINVIQDKTPKIIAYFDSFEKKYPQFDFDSINKMITNSVPTLTSLLQKIAGSTFSGIYGFGKSIVSWTLNIIIGIIVSCYIVLDKEILKNNFRRLIYAILPRKHAYAFTNTLRQCSDIFTNFVIGKSIDSLIIGLLCFTIMNFLGLKYAMLISLVVGITNMIPYFGPFIGAIPGCLILLMISPKQMFIFIILIFILQQFDGLFLGPKILGDSTGLRPIWIIFAITFGGWIAGFIGMFLGVPFVAVIAFLVEKQVDKQLKKHGIDMPTLKS